MDLLMQMEVINKIIWMIHVSGKEQTEQNVDDIYK